MNLKRKICYFLLFFLLNVGTAFSQQFKKQGIIYEDRGVKIELGIKIPAKACDVNNSRKAKYCLYITNFENLRSLRQYLNWKMDIANCSNDIMQQSFTIDLYSLKDKTLEYTDMDWEFEGRAIEKNFYDVSNDDYRKESKIQFKSKAISLPPDSIVGTLNILTGEPISLSIVGGTLTSDAKWVWYSGSCTNGKKEGEGPVLTKSALNKTTTFFVRAEGRENTGCVSRDVVVDNNSVAADAIMGKTKICKTDVSRKTLLYVVGGKKGLNANWVWYKNACPGFKLGEGDSIYVNPSETTTYFVRAEGPTIDPSGHVKLTVFVVEPSGKPEDIKVTQINTCAGEKVVLEAKGGSLSADAKWHWRSLQAGSYNYVEEGEGARIEVYPDMNTYYYLSAGDITCSSSEEISKLVEVKKLSDAPGSIDVHKRRRNRYTLSVSGGALGDNAKWVWYKLDPEDNSEKRIETGSEIIKYKARKKNNNVYVKAVGDCNATSSAYTRSGDITFLNRSGNKKNFWFLSGGIVAGQNDKIISNAVATFGCRYIYASAKFSFNTPPKYSLFEDGSTDFPGSSTSSYYFTGRLLSKRSSYTGGLMIGGNVFRIFLGGGIGEYTQVKEIETYNVVDGSSTQGMKDLSTRITGIEGEAGIFLRLEDLTISAGVNCIYSQQTQKQYFDGQVSIGFVLF